jgi:galactose mutarotase-like enzyme
MDMLWLPANGRWSGDQIRVMELKECTNSGRDVKIVYAGEMKSAVPGLKVEKTYTIHSGSASVGVDIRLKNQTPAPVTVSYWSHNMFKTPEGDQSWLLVRRKGGVDVLETRDPALSNRIYINPANGKQWQDHLIQLPANAVGESDGAAGLYSPKSRTGIALAIPTDFLQIYRWDPDDYSSLEWMHRPVTMQSGGTADISYRWTSAANLSVDELKKIMDR